MATTPLQPSTASAAGQPSAVFHGTVHDFLANLADRTPSPGGGAAAALAGAMSAALAQMVMAYALHSPKLAQHHPALQSHHQVSARFRALFTQLGEEDAAAYAVLNAAFKIPKDDPSRQSRIAAAAVDALAPPRAVLAAATDLLDRISQLPPITSRSLHSDLAVAASLAETASTAAAWNINANIPLLPKEQSPGNTTPTADPSSIPHPAGFTPSAILEHTKALVHRASALRADIDRQCGATP